MGAEGRGSNPSAPTNRINDLHGSRYWKLQTCSALAATKSTTRPWTLRSHLLLSDSFNCLNVTVSEADPLHVRQMIYLGIVDQGVTADLACRRKSALEIDPCTQDRFPTLQLATQFPRGEGATFKTSKILTLSISMSRGPLPSLIISFCSL